MLVVDDSDTLNDSTTTNSSEPSLQERFLAMKQRRVAAAQRVKAAENAQAHARSDEDKALLRKKFVEQVKSYIGTPYSATKSKVADAPPQRASTPCRVTMLRATSMRDPEPTVPAWRVRRRSSG